MFKKMNPFSIVGRRLDRALIQPWRALEKSAIEGERLAVRLQARVALLEARVQQLELERANNRSIQYTEEGVPESRQT